MKNIETKLTDFRLYLQNEYLLRTRKNNKYSLRSFAKLLGIGSSDLSKVLNQKRRVTSRLIDKVAPGLGLSDAQVKFFKKNLELQKSGKSKQINYTDLTLDTFRMIADWSHFAFLEATKIKGFLATKKSLAKRFGMSSTETFATIERLQRLGFLKENSDHVYEDCKGPTSTLHYSRTNEAKKLHQKQILERAIQALEKVPIQDRDHSSVIMAVDSSKLAEAKQLTKEYRRNLIELLTQSDKKDTVMALNIALFPLDQTNQNFKGESEI